MTLLILALFASMISLVGTSSVLNECGNAKLDVGEECDFAMAGSAECCSKDCLNLPSTFTPCSNGFGACQSGTCVTRETMCHSLDASVFSLTPDFAIGGPFEVCSAQSMERSSAEFYGCDNVCGGHLLSNNSFNCLNLNLVRLFADVPRTLPDGLVCSTSTTSSADMGVCIDAVCSIDKCRWIKCNNNGNCCKLGTLMREGSVKCLCDEGFSGSDCSITASCDGKVDACGVCNGNHSSCSAKLGGSGDYPGKAFLQIGLPILLLALTGTILGYFLLTCEKGVPWLSKKVNDINKYTHHENSFKIARKSSFLKAPCPTWRKFTPPPHANAKRGSDQEMPQNIVLKFDKYRVMTAYRPLMNDELELRVGDVILKIFEFDDGWAKGFNTCTGKEGMYPISLTEKILDTNPSGNYK